MKTYLVGGAVRDGLLGIKTKDNDFVVVGATQSQMIEAGYLQVGKDFPVFLHPKTKEEYALARTERKQGNGYKGFIFATENVSLEQDLERRDLTINSIAKDEQGNFVDPNNGLEDIKNKTLKHIGDAFLEDPVRVLRVARFAAKLYYLGFDIADETLLLMKNMVLSGEVEHLVPERVCAEMFKAFDTKNPEVFFEVLHKCGALKVIMPEVNALFGTPQRADYHPEIDTGIHTMMALADATKRGCNNLVKYGVLCHDLGKPLTPADILPSHHGHEERGVKPTSELSNRLKVPKDYKKLAMKTAEYHLKLHKVKELKATSILKLFNIFSAVRNEEEFVLFTEICTSDMRGRLSFENVEYKQAKYALNILKELSKLDTKQFITENLKGEKIGQAIYNGQVSYIKKIMKDLENQQN